MKKPKLTSAATIFVANFKSFSVQTMEEKIRGYVNDPSQHSVVQDFLTGISKAGADPHQVGKELLSMELVPITAETSEAEREKTLTETYTKMSTIQRQSRESVYAKLITEAQNPKKSSFRTSSSHKTPAPKVFQEVAAKPEVTFEDIQTTALAMTTT